MLSEQEWKRTKSRIATRNTELHPHARKGLGKRGHICCRHIVDHVSWARKRAGHKMNVEFPCSANWETLVANTKCFWTKSETFFVSRTQNLCLQQMLRARANGETFVSTTMCPQQCVLVCQGLNIFKESVLSEHPALISFSVPCSFSDNVHFQNTAQLVAALTKAGVKYQVQVSDSVSYDK